jgi:DNA-binding NarL/FixJ family response regulator
MSEQVVALVIAQPGQLRDSLQTLLTAIPRIDTVIGVNDCFTVLAMDMARHPAVMLTDFDLPLDKTPPSLLTLRANWPRMRWIALVDTEQQYQAARQIGADVVLLKGVLATRLLAAIEALLP